MDVIDRFTVIDLVRYCMLEYHPYQSLKENFAEGLRLLLQSFQKNPEDCSSTLSNI